MSKANDELPRIVVQSPCDADLNIFLDGCPSMPLPMRDLLLAMLELACLKQSLTAIACAVSSGHEGPFGQVEYGSLFEAVSEFNKMAFDRNYNFRLGVHIGDVVSPPENLANDHVRFALNSDKPMVTVWILEEGLLSPIMSVMRALIRKGVSGSGCIVKTDVPVHIFDPGSVLP